MGERARVDRVRLHACGGDRLRAQRMREVQLMPLGFEHVRKPLPAVGRLERDPQLVTELGQDRLQRLRLVRDRTGRRVPNVTGLDRLARTPSPIRS